MLHVSYQRDLNWIHTIAMEWSSALASNFEVVPLVLRVCWVAIDHSKSFAESLASIEQTRMQTVVGLVLVDGSWQPFRRHTRLHFGRTQNSPARVIEKVYTCLYDLYNCYWICSTNLLPDLDFAGGNNTMSCGLDVPQSLEDRQATRLGCSCHIPGLPWQKHSTMHRCDHQPGNKFHACSCRDCR